MTICGLCGKPVSEDQHDPTEIVLCKTCGDMLKGNFVFVVRCKDCKHYYKGHCQSDDTVYWCRDKEWFCADGERKDNENK